jgi:hypothetical protein
VAAADHLALTHNHRPNRHVVVLERLLSLSQGEAHEVFVAREEV